MMGCGAASGRYFFLHGIGRTVRRAQRSATSRAMVDCLWVGQGQRSYVYIRPHRPLFTHAALAEATWHKIKNKNAKKKIQKTGKKNLESNPTSAKDKIFAGKGDNASYIQLVWLGLQTCQGAQYSQWWNLHFNWPSTYKLKNHPTLLFMASKVYLFADWKFLLIQ